jgi:hypothetical protein
MLQNVLRFRPDYVGVSWDYAFADNDERILSVQSFQGNGRACGMILRISYVERIGSYTLRKKLFEDTDLFRRMDRTEILASRCRSIIMRSAETH